MENETLPPQRFTPLRLAGGGCIALAAGLVAVAAWDGGNPPAPATTAHTSLQAPGNTRWLAAPGELDVLPVMAPRPALPQRDTEAPLTENFPPLSLPASGQGAEVTFIVRIRDAPEVQTISRSYRRDRPAALSAWDSLVATHPGLADFELTGASYSGELRLTYRLPTGVAPTREAVSAVRDYLLAIDGVVYADPDVIAHAGKERNE